MSSSDPHRATVLFDEFGTPTFRADRESDYFLGVGVAYASEVEDYLFEHADKLFGLSNRSPLKNSRIRVSRAVSISQLLSELPVQVTVSSLDLSNDTLQQVANLYEQFGAEIRKFHRRADSRVVAQILHDNILDDTLFGSITRYLEINQTPESFEIFIDEWAIPESDIEVALEFRSRSLRQKIAELHQKYGLAIPANVSPIGRLIEDTPRKRFIDVVTSTVSRFFLPERNPRHSPIPLQNILGNRHNQCNDFTDHTIQFLRKVMDEFSRNPGP